MKNNINFFRTIKQFTIEYISKNKLFFFYAILSILVCILLRMVTIGFGIYLNAFIIDLSFIIFLGLLGYLFKPKDRYIYYLLLLIFISILSIANTIYYEFYQSFISINLISTASMISKVNASLFDKIHLSQFIYIIFPISYMYIYKKVNTKNYLDKFENYEIKYNILKKILSVFIFIVLYLIISISINDTKILDNQFNRGYIVKKYGLFLYTINDIFHSVDFDYQKSYDKAAYSYRQYYSCKWEKDKKTNDYTNIFKGKNLLFIHAESIQNFLIDLKINGKEVTPNLNDFVEDGLYFSKFYPQPSVGTSSDTEFTLLTGLMPSSKGTIFVNYYDRKYYAMPQYFNKLGYYTFSMHANDRNYWNRAVMHEKLGYQDFFASESYDIPTSINDKNYIGLGLSDNEFFKQSISKLQNIKDKKIPFFGTIITLSNHSPFNDIEKYGEFDVTLEYEYENEYGKIIKDTRNYLEGTKMGNYLKSAHYADQAFGNFIDMLKDTNILDNTIIIFYGDHEAKLPKNDFDILYNYYPINDSIKDEDDPTYINIDNYYYDLIKNTPFIIWSNEIDLSANINETMGMYDVLPTIANMFGFEEKYSLGHDIFNDDENIVVFPNGNIITDKIYYNYLNKEYITLDNTPIKDDYINEITEYADTILEISNGIVTYDLIEKEKENVGSCEK